jgi:hypothetical protein
LLLNCQRVCVDAVVDVPKYPNRTRAVEFGDTPEMALELVVLFGMLYSSSPTKMLGTPGEVDMHPMSTKAKCVSYTQ